MARLLAELLANEDRQRARRAEDLNRLRSVLEVFVLDLVVAAKEDPGRFIAYPLRRQEFGTELKRYSFLAATRTTVVAVSEFLQASGYALGTLGSYTRTDWGNGVSTGGGYRSRLRATPKLLALVRELGVSSDDIGTRGDFELIRLKSRSEGGRKELKGYRDTDQTRAWRSELQRWAEVAAAHRIVAPAGLTLPEGALKDEDDGAGELVDPKRAQLYRVFNEGRFDRGGRFYGGWWMGLSKAARASITIDGEPVVELDFKAFYPRLCYDLEGIKLDPSIDPYEVPALKGRVDRKALKVALNQLIAVGPGVTPRRPQGASIPSRLPYRAVLEALERQHPAMRPWLRQARSLELQRIDSEIADGVLRYMTMERARPVLPVHDSFVVAGRDEANLGEAMARTYRAVVAERSGKGAWPVIDGWSSPALRDEVSQRIGL
ncbi:hypothetical protein MMB232_00771 [Brevundimonas subvibrioides]|uniref:hypothetical protein n=1 Tax=Brevundimonas subvibrioides TaxID=74313 RepID=UPI0032D5A76C